jgi:hypothetical protein
MQVNVLQQLAGCYDFVAAHFYCGADVHKLSFEDITLSENYRMLDRALKIQALLRAYNGGRKTCQYDTEWGMICSAPGGKTADYEDRNANIIGTVHRAVRLIYYAREGILRGASGWQMLSALNGQGFGILSQQAPEQRFLLYWLYYYFNRHVGEWALRTLYRLTKLVDPTRPALDTSGYFHYVTDIWDCHNYEQDVARFSAAFEPLARGDHARAFSNSERQLPYEGDRPYFVSEYGGIWWNPGQKDADALFPQVVFLPALRQYVMMVCLNAWREIGKPERSGIYAAFSVDGIHWPRERMQQIWKVPVIALIGREVAWHPTFIPDGDGDTHGWLYYGYSENWGHQPPHKPHYLMRRPIAIVGSDP